MNKIFQLNFLGVADSSSSTLNALRGVFSSAFGLSEEQIETIFLSAPVTLIESSNKEDLIPIYEFLKSASAHVIIEEIFDENDEEEDSDDDNPAEFDLSDEEHDSLEVEKVAQGISAPQTKIVASSEEVSFDFDSGNLEDSPPLIANDPVKSKKTEEDLAIFSFDDQEDEEEDDDQPEEFDQISNNANEQDISLSFDTEDEVVAPNLAKVNSAKLISDSIINSPEAPLKSNALKLNFDIKPKDQVFLENLKKQREDSVVKITDEEIELKDGPVIIPEGLASTGFDNIIHKSTQNTTEVFRPRKPIIQKETLQYLIPILIGCSFVLVGSFLILPKPEEPNQATSAAQSVEPVNSNKANPTTEITKANSLNSKYYGKSVDQDVIVEGTLTRYSNELKNISLVITPPPPQALTPEDLVLNKKLPPWIEKLTVDQLTLNPSKGDSSFLGIAKARIFVNYDQQKYRLIVPVAVRAVLNKDWNTARVAVVLKAGIKDPPEVPYLVEIEGNGQHKVYLKSIFEVSEVMEEVEVTAEATSAEAPSK